jgi:hypothetical protein
LAGEMCDSDNAMFEFSILDSYVFGRFVIEVQSIADKPDNISVSGFVSYLCMTP